MIDIRPANVRDVSYVVTHLRERDRQEIFCQLPEGAKNYDVAYSTVMPDENMAYVAYENDTPTAVMGVQLMTVTTGIVFAFGTDRMKRAVPALSDFFALEVIPALRAQGVEYLEARSIVGHIEAHKWIMSGGGRPITAPFPYGRNGEKFILFRWTASQFDAIRAKRRRWRERNDEVQHVHRHAETPISTPCSRQAEG